MTVVTEPEFVTDAAPAMRVMRLSAEARTVAKRDVVAIRDNALSPITHAVLFR